MSFRIRYSSGSPFLNRPATSFSPRLPFCFGLFHQSRNIRSTTRSANTPPIILNIGLKDSTTASIRQAPLRQPYLRVADTFVPFPCISRGNFPVGGFIPAFARCCFCIAASLLVFTSPTVFPLLPRSIPNLPRNLPRKPPRNLSLHFLLRQAYTVKTYTEVSDPFTPMGVPCVIAPPLHHFSWRRVGE